MQNLFSAFLYLFFAIQLSPASTCCCSHLSLWRKMTTHFLRERPWGFSAPMRLTPPPSRQVCLPKGGQSAFASFIQRLQQKSSQPSLNNGMRFHKDNSMSTASLLISTRLWKETNTLLKTGLFFLLKLTAEPVPLHLTFSGTPASFLLVRGQPFSSLSDW